MTTKPLTKTKKKVNIDGKQQKVDHNVYLVLQNLTEALKQHEIALLTWVHKVYNQRDNNNEEEEMLHDYCMQIPDAAGILTRMKAIDEEVKQEESNGSTDSIGDAEDNGSANSEK
tara:strand:+ start:2681 stop:3025 length:345 start_codon:yes stop_codon:yes gene_type:complete